MDAYDSIGSIYQIFDFCTDLFYQIYATSQDIIYFITRPVKLLRSPATWLVEWILKAFGVELSTFTYIDLMFTGGIVIVLVWAFVKFILPTS
jgi:hypothetical protein